MVGAQFKSNCYFGFVADYLKSATVKSPEVLLNEQTGTLSIVGRSLIEYAMQFYQPIFDWTKEYCKSPKPLTTLELGFEYLNSDSMKCMYGILKILKDNIKEPNQLKIIWKYEADDDDLKKTGESFQNAVGLSFDFVEVDEL